MKGMPHVLMPNLINKVIQLLEDFYRYQILNNTSKHNNCQIFVSCGRLTWHNDVIPANEIWVKVGGDKVGDVLNTFKTNFQIVNVPAPNSVHNTSCFEAGDSVINLHSRYGTK